VKPSLEQIQLKEVQRSFKYFKLNTKAFKPYWHYHPELELTLILKGQGTRFIGDSIRPFNDLDLVLVGSNIPHHWVGKSTKEDQIAYVFQFSKALFSPFYECSELLTLFNRAQRGLHFKDVPEQLVKDIKAFENYNPIGRLSALINLMGKLLHHSSVDLLVSSDYKVRLEKTSSQLKFTRINNYILENINKKMTIQEVSDIAHMVPQSFCRWFKQHSGHSFISFVNITRIEFACQLMLTKELPIQDIAFSSGFDSISHFNRTFKRIKTLSPSAFKKLNQKP
jgi:AraC-like DNA-binding protein